MALAPLCVVAQERPLAIVFFEDYAPFSFRADGKEKGILLDILSEALDKRMKLPIAIKLGPWARMQELVKNSEADAFCTNATADRRVYTVPGKVPTISFPYKIFTTKSSPKLDALKAVDSLEKLRSGAVAGNFTLGSFIGDGWTKANLEDAKVKIDYSPQQDNVILKLAYGRFDAFANNAIVERYSTKKLADSLKAQGKEADYQKVMAIIELDGTVDKAQFFFCIGKTSPYLKYLDQLDTVLGQMQKDGFIDKVMQNYK